MEKCKQENVKAGDTYQNIMTGRIYIVTNTSGKKLLHNLNDGNVYSINSVFGDSKENFKKIAVCYSVCEE